METSLNRIRSINKKFLKLITRWMVNCSI